MSNTTIQMKIFNSETGEEIIRDATAEEIAKIEEDRIADAQAKAEAKAKVEAKAALLDRLGITAEEAALLLS